MRHILRYLFVFIPNLKKIWNNEYRWILFVDFKKGNNNDNVYKKFQHSLEINLFFTNVIKNADNWIGNIITKLLSGLLTKSILVVAIICEIA